MRRVIHSFFCAFLFCVSCTQMYGLDMRDDNDSDSVQVDDDVITEDSATIGDSGADTDSSSDTTVPGETDDSNDTDSSTDTDSFAIPVITVDQSSPMQLDFNEDATVLTGTIVAKAGLKQVTVRYLVNDETVDTKRWDTFAAPPVSINSNQTYALALAVTDIKNDLTVILTATDIVEQQSEAVTIDIHPATRIPVQEFNVKLGAQDHDWGPTACLTSGDIFSVSEVANSEAALHSDLVDIFYFYATTRKATLYAPNNKLLYNDDTGVDAIKNGGWKYQNSTKLGKLSITAAQFDAVDYCHELPVSPASDIAADLAEGDVVAFETEENLETERSAHKGIMKVVKLEEGNTGFISLDVKVEP
ncbi:MAG: hypothetical protein JXR76_28395 [Deltaproteobacteria bacterium]|nr:hypothetical protein [Deltaproteobacteria bacterium]